MIGLFGIYVASIAWVISKGHITAPELSDTDSGSDEGEFHIQPEANSSTERTGSTARNEERAERMIRDDALDAGNTTVEQQPPFVVDMERSNPAAPVSGTQAPSPSSPSRTGSRHSISYHISLLVLGVLAIVLSSYVLSHAASNLADEFGISDVLFGVVILSIATTLPEKFVAAISGFRGHAGIMVANTVGSNIFLLSLCMGILWVSTGGSFNQGSVNVPELVVMLGSTAAMTLTVWFGSRWSRWIGPLMLLAYIVFLVLEFTIIRRVWSDET
jgi:Ca2+/H+ antiporter